MDSPCRSDRTCAENFSTLQKMMGQVNVAQHDDNGRAAGGLAALVESFLNILGLKSVPPCLQYS